MHVFSDIVNTLKDGDVYYRLSSENGSLPMENYLPKNYRETREQKRLERFVILARDGARRKKESPSREVVTIPLELDDFEDNMSLTIYGHKMAYIDMNKENIIIIEHPELVEFQRKMFRIMFIGLRE
jgi:hypothetical protein